MEICERDYPFVISKNHVTPGWAPPPVIPVKDGINETLSWDIFWTPEFAGVTGGYGYQFRGNRSTGSVFDPRRI